MALDYTAATKRNQAGGVAHAPLFLDRIETPGDTSYATGGYTMDSFLESLLEASRSIQDIQGYGSNGTTKVDVRWNAATGKMLVLTTSSGAEVANATNLSGYTFYLSIWSK